MNAITRKFDMDVAIKLKADGFNIKEIAAALGVAKSTASKHMSPNYRQKDIEYRRRNVLGVRPKSPIFMAERALKAEEVEARMAEIPEDTRNLTSRAFGDPLPGRSALDRRLK